MSRRARQRQDARPWNRHTPKDPIEEIDWAALEADRARRESQQQPTPQQGKTQ